MNGRECAPRHSGYYGHVVTVMRVEVLARIYLRSGKFRSVPNPLRGGEGVNHVKRDWLEILNVNCDLYLFFCVKRDWGYLRET